MSIPVSTLAARREEFCKRYKVPKRYHGSLAMLAEMAFIFELEMEPVMTRKPEAPAPQGDL